MISADALKQMRPEEAKLIIKALGLRKKYEDLLIMRYVDEMSCEEIADVKHKEVQTIRNEVCKARKIFTKFANL